VNNSRNYLGKALGDNSEPETLEIIIQGPLRALGYLVLGALGAFLAFFWIWTIYFLLGGQ
jgi:hypothetical protein